MRQKKSILKTRQALKPFDESSPLMFRDIIKHSHRFVSLVERTTDIILREKENLPLSHFKILMALHRGHCDTQHSIALFWSITPAAVNRQIQILRSKGYIDTGPLPTLTVKGKEKIFSAMTTIDPIFEKAFAKIDKNEKIKTVKTLIDMHDALESLEDIHHLTNKK